jgi:hypothetical protein
MAGDYFFQHAILTLQWPPGFLFDDPIVSNWKIADAYLASFFTLL